MQIAVVIPTYNARETILNVVQNIPKDISKIIIVDDKCPQKSSELVENNISDERVVVIRNEQNLGVGGATQIGFKTAFSYDVDICVKVDSDDQIDPQLVKPLVAFMLEKECGYAKGSRFTTRKNFNNMPTYRILLNSILSFTNKLASGYYSLNDPTNGLIAITRHAFESIEFERVAKRYFFESDMLHHLGLARIKCCDFPMRAIYADEKSGLKIRDEIFSFMHGNIRNFFRRIFIRHFILNFSVPAIYFSMSFVLIFVGSIIGLYHLFFNNLQGEALPAGIVIWPAFLLILGINFLTNFFVLDVRDEPS